MIAPEFRIIAGINRVQWPVIDRWNATEAAVEWANVVITLGSGPGCSCRHIAHCR